MNKNKIFRKMYNNKRNYLIPILNTNNNINPNIKPSKDKKTHYDNNLRNMISSSNISYRKNTKKSNIRYIDNYTKHKSNSISKINIFNDSDSNPDNDIKIPNKPKKNKFAINRNNSQNYLLSNPNKTKSISTLINQKNKSQIFSCLETKNYYELINNTKYLVNNQETAPLYPKNSNKKLYRSTSQPKVNCNNNSIFHSRNIDQLNNENDSKIYLCNSGRGNNHNKNNCNISNYYVIDKKPVEKKLYKNKSCIYNEKDTDSIFNLNKIKMKNKKGHNRHNNSVILKLSKEENYTKKIDTFNNIYFNNSNINSNNNKNRRILLADEQNSPKIVDSLKTYKEMVINKLGIKNNNSNNNNNKDTKSQTKTQTVSSVSLSTSLPNSLNPKKIIKQNNYNNYNNKNINLPAKPLMTNEMLSFPMEEVDDGSNDTFDKNEFKASNTKTVNKKTNISYGSYGPEDIHFKFVELYKYQKKFYNNLEKKSGNNKENLEPDEAKYFENYGEKVPFI